MPVVSLPSMTQLLPLLPCGESANSHFSDAQLRTPHQHEQLEPSGTATAERFKFSLDHLFFRQLLALSLYIQNALRNIPPPRKWGPLPSIAFTPVASLTIHIPQTTPRSAPWRSAPSLLLHNHRSPRQFCRLHLGLLCEHANREHSLLRSWPRRHRRRPLD